MNCRNGYSEFLQATKRCIKNGLHSAVLSIRDRASGWWSQRPLATGRSLDDSRQILSPPKAINIDDLAHTIQD